MIEIFIFLEKTKLLTYRRVLGFDLLFRARIEVHYEIVRLGSRGNALDL